jgi:hypothetical protein
MAQTAISGKRRTGHSIAETLWDWRGEAVWILAGAILLLVFVDPLTLLALGFAAAAVTAPWWTYRRVPHHTELEHSNNAKSAWATPRRPSAPPPWRGSSAA